MPIGDNISTPRKVMTLFLLVDSSGSMTTDGNMGKVNGAVEEMLPLLRDISNNSNDAEIRIAVLDFSTGCKWVGGGVHDLDEFDWNDMQAGGLTDMGAAFIELESKLSRSAFMNNAAGNYAPVIILLSDGAPTDDYRSGLAKLQHNNWYKSAIKIAIAVENSSRETLAEFTGSTETVLNYDGQHDDLKKLLTRLATVSSTMQSRSVNVSEENDDPDKKSKEVVKKVKEDLEEEKKAEEEQKNKSPKKKDPWDDDDGVWNS